MFSVLIVDDEPPIIEVMSMTIKWGDFGFYIAETASNAIDALDILKRRRIDLIFTDIRMPQMNGIAFIKEIRKTNPLSEIIIISVYNNFEYAKEALLYRVDSYILKPIDPDEVAERLIAARNRLQSLQPVENGETEENYGSISEIVKYVKDNFKKDLTLKNIAKLFYMNSAYLGYKFKQVTGEPFNFYLNRLRIEYVKEQSGYENRKIGEIITEAGFSNHQYFYRQCKKIKGSAFSDYRKEKAKADL